MGAIEAAGLDPRQVKYVLATHEHGDHGPGAYLWRVVTGAQFVTSREMAYMLRPSRAYGLRLWLSSAESRGCRCRPGHEARAGWLAGRCPAPARSHFGSMGWMFEMGGQRFVATGDLIMPSGALGYAGSVNFSAADALSSLRKLDGLQVTSVLPGHGPHGDPNRYIAAGLSVGRHVGWGKIKPTEPDPRFRLTQEMSSSWPGTLTPRATDFGDLNADGRPDVAVTTADGSGAAVKIYLNRNGKFPARAGPSARRAAWVAARVSCGFASSTMMPSPISWSAGLGQRLLLSRGSPLQYDILALDVGDSHQVHRVSPDAKQPAIVLNQSFGAFRAVVPSGDRAQGKSFKPEINGPYGDVRELDLNGDVPQRLGNVRRSDLLACDRWHNSVRAKSILTRGRC